jgi:hypothetical protein
MVPTDADHDARPAPTMVSTDAEHPDPALLPAH